MAVSEALGGALEELDHWVDALVEATEELATSALCLDGATVVATSDQIPTGMRGSYVALVSEDVSLQFGVVATPDACASLARGLLFMEADEELADEDLADAVNEVANIVGGGVKRRMVDADPGLKLGLPMFIDGAIKPTQQLETRCVTVGLGDYEVHLLTLRHKA